MDPVGRAVLMVKEQRNRLKDELEDSKRLLDLAIHGDTKRELRGIIKRNEAAIEGLDYFLSFLENVKEEICLD